MGLMARLKEMRQKKLAQRATRPIAGQKDGVFWLTLILLVLTAAVVGLGVLSFYEFFIWTKVPAELVGVWEVEQGPYERSTFTFSRNGTLDVERRVQKKRVNLKMRVRVEGKTLVTTGSMSVLNNPVGESVSTESTIRELTADTLILDMDKGEVLRMVRIE